MTAPQDSQNKVESYSPTISHICSSLSQALPKRVTYPNSTAYTQYQTTYWSNQEADLQPSCVISPTTTEEVSIAVKILTSDENVQFAIRGGGHTPFAGSASIDNGVVVDMRAINEVTINEDKTIASVGAGAVWGDVYSKLDGLGVTVVGGRGSTIGVGGLITGGGISFFSPRKGFACDNVVNYEVVLADGRVVNANSMENKDLWLALKGGSNNFGIVTRFDLSAFSRGDFWGGMIIWDDSASLELLSAFTDLNGVDYDEYAALMLSFSFVPAMGFVASGTLQYTKLEREPSTFKPFTSITPQYANTMRISKHTDFVTEFVEHQGRGRRQLYIALTLHTSLPLLTKIHTHFKTTLTPPKTKIPTLQASLTIQPLPPTMIKKPNSLGLQTSTGALPLTLLLLSFTWDNASDDEAVTNLGKDLHTWIAKKAQEEGMYNEWVYLNYAADWQDPIRERGEELRRVSKVFDPEGVFQRQVRGGFKLFS